MKLEDLRKQIDEIDDRLLRDFTDRMAAVERISAAKREAGRPVLDPDRERQKLDDVAAKLPPELEKYGRALWSLLFEISRSRQSELAGQGTEGDASRLSREDASEPAGEEAV